MEVVSQLQASSTVAGHAIRFDEAKEMPKDASDVAPAGPAPDRRLMWGEVGLDRGANHIHQGAAKQPPKTPRELQRPLAIHCVGEKFLADP